ncbi:MAG: AAA family ATPase, partial [Bacteroidales bacterium]|nr:AAA family ATPase [Bacteroidales bacterium]
MELERKEYLQKLIRKKDNGRVKIITGIRRCGKSYLLFELYTRYLRENGIGEDQ